MWRRGLLDAAGKERGGSALVQAARLLSRPGSFMGGILRKDLLDPWDEAAGGCGAGWRVCGRGSGEVGVKHKTQNPWGCRYCGGVEAGSGARLLGEGRTHNAGSGRGWSRAAGLGSPLVTWAPSSAKQQGPPAPSTPTPPKPPPTSPPTSPLTSPPTSPAASPPPPTRRAQSKCTARSTPPTPRRTAW